MLHKYIFVYLVEQHTEVLKEILNVSAQIQNFVIALLGKLCAGI